MAEQVLVQFRADKALKQEAAEIYEAMGMDLPTAFRMFMAKSVQVRGLPFEAKLSEDVVTRSDGIKAFKEIRRQLADIPEMSLEEINAEIEEIRSERKTKR